MASWSKFLASVQRRVEALHSAGCPDIYFRGHACADWLLEPGLARHRRFNKNYSEEFTEQRLFWSFRMRGAHLLPTAANGWTTLFYMQHFGLPTRLLDWSTSFASALYFGIADGKAKSPCIWILDPYHLNNRFSNSDDVKNISVSHEIDYIQFMELAEKPFGAIATEGDSSLERIRSQAGSFTLHSDLGHPLEQLCPSAITKHVLDVDHIPKAEKYLELAGVDDFSIFPDLSGLAAKIRKREL
ncbi:MAG: FRG domain-containing protein [Paucibacter sp.]|nr:FRG domain-containing protein [Roseateles sp.]